MKNNANHYFRITTNPGRVFSKTYSRDFHWKDDPGAGYSFECSKLGTFPASQNAASKMNLREAINSLEMIDEGVVESEHSYFEPASGECSCGESFALNDPLDNACPGCLAVYNSSGQRVTDSRECDQWGNPIDFYWSS